MPVSRLPCGLQHAKKDKRKQSVVVPMLVLTAFLCGMIYLSREPWEKSAPRPDVTLDGVITAQELQEVVDRANVIHAKHHADMANLHKRLDIMEDVIKVIENRRGQEPPRTLGEQRAYRRGYE